MKRVLNVSLYFFFLSLLIFSSCTKEPLEVEQQSTEVITNTEKITDIITTAPEDKTKENQDSPNADFCFDNPNNPYDYVGVEHNAALDAVAAHPDFGNLTSEQVYNIIGQTVRDRNGVDVSVSFADAEGAYAMIGTEPNGAFDNAVNFGVEDGKLSPQASDRLYELKSILESSPDPIAYGHAMIAFENSVMNNGSYTECELEIILGAASMGRHSACYWGNAAINADNPWHGMLDLGGGNRDALWWWWPRIIRIILWDIIGFIWGFLWFCWTFPFWCIPFGIWFGIWFGAWLSALAACI